MLKIVHHIALGSGTTSKNSLKDSEGFDPLAVPDTLRALAEVR